MPTRQDQNRRRQELYALLGDLPDRHRPVTAQRAARIPTAFCVLERLVLDLNGIEPVPAYFARPLTAAEWTELLTDAGFTVEKIAYAPMALLEPHRLIADEGLLGALRFVVNVLRDSDARARVLNMRATFRRHRDNMAAIEVIAAKPA